MLKDKNEREAFLASKTKAEQYFKDNRKRLDLIYKIKVSLNSLDLENLIEIEKIIKIK